MPIEQRKVLVEPTEQRSGAGHLPGREPDSGAVAQPHVPRPLDWGHVVDAAAARLEESWVHPDTTGHMVASGLAGELAATLCAYGMEAEEVDHMNDMADALPPGSQIARK